MIVIDRLNQMDLPKGLMRYGTSGMGAVSFPSVKSKFERDCKPT